jgi:hypothetical protein
MPLKGRQKGDKKGDKNVSVTGGLQKSHKGVLYDGRGDPRRAAGYIGLQDTAFLRDLYKSTTFQKIWKEHEDENHEMVQRQFRVRSVDGVMEQISATSAKLKLGKSDVERSNWNCTKLFAHTICKLLDQEKRLPGGGTFGPLKSETDIEARNRAYTLLSNYKYMKNANNKEVLEDATSHPTKIPRFMIPKSDDSLQMRKAYGPRHSFRYRWRNKRDFEEAFNEENNGISLPDKDFFRKVDP